jgi:hypothetical protein
MSASKRRAAKVLMEKTNEDINRLPEVYFGSGEACITYACDFARNGKQVAVFIEPRHRPLNWSVQRRGIYALCDEELGTKAGLERALQFVEHQYFDVLLFATRANEYDESAPDSLIYSMDQTEVIKAAVFTSFEMNTRYQRLTMQGDEDDKGFRECAE